MELSDFLAARIAEDEAVAREAQRESSYGLADSAFDEAVELAENEGAVREATAHIARHDPARVLAECDAKRRIVEKYRATMAAQEANTDEHTRASSHVDRHGELPLLRRDGWVYDGRLWGLKVALAFLAVPYADHEDYDPEWKP